jgi:hypothetical protein
MLLTSGLLAATLLPSIDARWIDHTSSASRGRVRTVVTTDMEQDDLASIVRYLLYTADLDTQGIVYSASRYHWEGDYKGTRFFLPGREYNTSQTSWRWTGNTTIEDVVIPAYSQVYENLRVHDPNFPTPAKLLSLVKIGNVDFEGAFSQDTDGSRLIEALILDNDPRPLYLQAWGGTNTIARALRSIEEQYSSSSQWATLKQSISHKVVITASGFQDETYDDYIAPVWPRLQVRASSVAWTAYNCNKNSTGNVRGLPDDHVYFTGAWIRENIQTGPYGKLYRSWLDNQHMAGDQLDVFGNTTAFPIMATDWCQPLRPYDFLGEGDDGTYLPLLTTGMQDPSDPNLGGWGGRSARNMTGSANLWQSVKAERASNGTEVVNYGTNRFISAAQNDMAARIQWTLTSQYDQGNHPPSVRVLGGGTINARAGETVKLTSTVSDPDGDKVNTSWWQYFEEGTYNGTVNITNVESNRAVVNIPTDAKDGQPISIILQGTDHGEFPLTRYDRVMIRIC